METKTKASAQNGQLPAVVIPTLKQLIMESEENETKDALIVILNQPPPNKWLKPHPTAKVKNDKGESVAMSYLPINKIEFLLTKIYRKWNVEVRSVQSIANSVCVTVRLYVTNPLTGQVEWQDGVGASPIQTNSGAGAMDWNAIKSAAVMMALPAAETYAVKDAAEKFGKVFGRDLARTENMDYNVFLPENMVSLQDLKELYDLKKDALSKDEKANAERIINNNETNSFKKLKKQLEGK